MCPRTATHFEHRKQELTLLVVNDAALVVADAAVDLVFVVVAAVLVVVMIRKNYGRGKERTTMEMGQGRPSSLAV